MSVKLAARLSTLANRRVFVASRRGTAGVAAHRGGVRPRLVPAFRGGHGPWPAGRIAGSPRVGADRPAADGGGAVAALGCACRGIVPRLLPLPGRLGPPPG